MIKTISSVCHTRDTEGKEYGNAFDQIGLKLLVARLGEEDGSDQFTFGCREACRTKVKIITGWLVDALTPNAPDSETPSGATFWLNPLYRLLKTRRQNLESRLLNRGFMSFPKI